VPSAPPASRLTPGALGLPQKTRAGFKMDGQRHLVISICRNRADLAGRLKRQMADSPGDVGHPSEASPSSLSRAKHPGHPVSGWWQRGTPLSSWWVRRR